MAGVLERVAGRRATVCEAGMLCVGAGGDGRERRVGEAGESRMWADGSGRRQWVCEAGKLCVSAGGDGRARVCFGLTDRLITAEGGAGRRQGLGAPHDCYRCTRPEPPPLMSACTSSAEKRLKSPGMECFRQLAATANSRAS